MKSAFALFGVVATAALLAAASLRAAPLASTAAVQTRPDPSAPVIGVLPAGAEPTPAAAAPGGWIAVSLPGPFKAYVRDQDLNKALEVRPGSSLYLEPNAGSGVLAIAVKGDKIEITGLEGRWTQVRLGQPVIGYVNLAAAPVSQPPAAAAEPAPNNAPGHPAPAGAAEGSAAERYFEGRFVSTHRRFAPRRPFAWELETSGGARIAYLDVGRLLQT
ncbi:MAG: hypothetical protein ACREFX_01815, partial [Opitutaceae bacterium]